MTLIDKNMSNKKRLREIGKIASVQLILRASCACLLFLIVFKSSSICAQDDQRKRASLYYEAGNSAFESGGYAEAIAAYKEAIKVVGDFAPLYHNLAMAQLMIGQKSESLNNFKKYMELRPHEPAPKGLPADMKKALEEYGAEIMRKRKQTEKIVPSVQDSATQRTESQLPKPSLSASSATNVRKLAIFPWHFRGDSIGFAQNVVSSLQRLVNETMPFQIILDDYAGDTTGVWRKKGFFSHLEPNINGICKRGQQLDVDVVLLCSFLISERQSGWPMLEDFEVVLIDIHREKAFSSKRNVGLLVHQGTEILSQIESMTRRVFRDYESNN